MRIVVVASFPEALYRFRGDLIREFIVAGHEVVCLAPPGDETVREEVERLGAELRSIPMNRTSTGLLGDLKLLFVLYRIFRELKPEAVLCYTIKPVIYGTLGAWFAGVRRIYS